MNGLSWSDNICTVGWTCIHGQFSIDEMRELLDLQPEGSFTPTFNGLGLGFVDNEDMFERMMVRKMNRGSFYFNFPWKGSESLVNYLLMKDIKMTPEVEDKARKFHDAYWHQVMRTL